MLKPWSHFSRNVNLLADRARSVAIPGIWDPPPVILQHRQLMVLQILWASRTHLEHRTQISVLWYSATRRKRPKCGIIYSNNLSTLWYGAHIIKFTQPVFLKNKRKHKHNWKFESFSQTSRNCHKCSPCIPREYLNPTVETSAQECGPLRAAAV